VIKVKKKMDCIKTVLFNALNYINSLEEDELYKRHSMPSDLDSYTESQFVELYRRSSKKKFGFLGAIVVFIIVVVIIFCVIAACSTILKKKELFKMNNTVGVSNSGYSNNNSIQYSNMNTQNVNTLISSDDSNPYLNGQYAQSFQNSNTATAELQQVPPSYQPQNYYQNPGYYSYPNNVQQGYYSYQNYPQQEFRQADTDNTENNKTKETT